MSNAALRGAASVARMVSAPVALVAVIVAAWYAIIWALNLPPYLMPTPLGAGTALVREHRLILFNLLYTVGEAAAGLIAGTALAIGTAGLSVAIPAFGRSVLPFAVALRSTPVVAVAPLVTLLVGRGFQTGVTVVIVACFFPIMVNAARGFGSMSTRHGELMHVLAASHWQIFCRVRLPFALPHVFAGLRIAAPLAVLGAMLAEWLTGSRGVGYLMLDAAAMREQELLWAAISVSMALALTVFWTTASLEQWLVRRRG